MTYNVFGGTLNLALSIYLDILCTTTTAAYKAANFLSIRCGS